MFRNWNDVREALRHIPSEKTPYNVLAKFMVYYEFLADERGWDIPVKMRNRYKNIAIKRRDSLREEYYALLDEEQNPERN